MPESSVLMTKQKRAVRSRKPKLLIRVSARDRSLILAGLDWIVGNHKLWLNGRRRVSSLKRVLAHSYDHGVYSQQMMDDVLVVGSRLECLPSS